MQSFDPTRARRVFHVLLKAGMFLGSLWPGLAVTHFFDVTVYGCLFTQFSDTPSNLTVNRYDTVRL